MRAKKNGRLVYTRRGPDAVTRATRDPQKAAAARHAINGLPDEVKQWYESNSRNIPMIVKGRDGGSVFQGFQQHQFDEKFRKGAVADGTDHLSNQASSSKFREGYISSRAGDSLEADIAKNLNEVFHHFGGSGFTTGRIPKHQVSTRTTRMRTPWWILDEERFQWFIQQFIDSKLIRARQDGAWSLRDFAHLRRATRAYIALAEFYLEGKTDDDIVRDHPHVWSNTAALKMYRKRLCDLGRDQFGLKSQAGEFLWEGHHYDLEWAIVRGDVAAG